MYTEDDWHECWATGHTPWRGESVDAGLLRIYQANAEVLGHVGSPVVPHAPKTSPRRSALVPLCGDSPVVRFLYDAGFSVTGVEFVDDALRALLASSFPELIPHVGAEKLSLPFVTDRLALINDDIFTLPAIPSFDLVYDRAALIALAPEVRTRYAALITTVINPGGHLLLETTTMTGRGEKGPPFSVERAEINRLYSGFLVIAEESTEPTPPSPNLAERGVSDIVHHRLLLRRNQ